MASEGTVDTITEKFPLEASDCDASASYTLCILRAMEGDKKEYYKVTYQIKSYGRITSMCLLPCAVEEKVTGNCYQVEMTISETTYHQLLGAQKDNCRREVHQIK